MLSSSRSIKGPRSGPIGLMSLGAVRLKVLVAARHCVVRRRLSSWCSGRYADRRVNKNVSIAKDVRAFSPSA
jgi:hypothetical protein